MEPENRYPLIGAVVLVLALAAGLVFAWWARDGGTDARLYTVVFNRQSVEGLQVGSDVSMRGVKVGRVERFTLGSENINRVKVLIRVDSQTPVSDNTAAVVARNIVTGLARINLETPGQPGPPLIEIPEGEEHPVIAEGTSGMDQIAESANRLALSGEEALANLNLLMSPDNVKAFGETLAATRDIAVGLSQRLSAMDRSLAGVDAAALAFTDASRRIGATTELVSRQLKPLAGQVGPALQEGRALLVEARGTLEAFSGLARTLEREAAALGERTGGAADAGLLELRATAQETRRAAELLSQALERLSEPRSALIGPGAGELGPGEGGR